MASVGICLMEPSVISLDLLILQPLRLKACVISWKSAQTQKMTGDEDVPGKGFCQSLDVSKTSLNTDHKHPSTQTLS